VNIAFFHQAGNAFITDVNAFVDEIGLNARTSVRLARFSPIRFNPITQLVSQGVVYEPAGLVG
jgi:hypothetical protein